MSYILEVNNLEKSYKNKKAVDGISFSLEEGKMLAFLGLNGAGKSTTINILCQVISRDFGDVKIFGKDIDKYSNEIKKEIGIVFQSSILDKDLTIYSNLKFKANLFGLNKNEFKEKINFLDELLDLKPLLKRKYNKLSGGEKRRVDIAYGLINTPKILFLDEPTTGLDPVNREKVWKAIKYMIEEKHITVFLTTHYMNEADNSDRIIIIDNGKIIADGTPDELKNKYSNNKLIVNKEYSEKDFKLFQKHFDNVSYEHNKYIIKIEKTKDLFEIKEEVKKIIGDFEVIKGNIDDVFLNVTGKGLSNE